MDLLDYLAKLLGCTYLSDLRFASARAEQIDALLSLPEDQFSLDQYQMALEYLYGTPTQIPDCAAARRLLVQILEIRPGASVT